MTCAQFHEICFDPRTLRPPYAFSSSEARASSWPRVHTMCFHLTGNAKQSSVCLARRQLASDSCLEPKLAFGLFCSLCNLLRIRKTHLCCLPLFDLTVQTFNCHHVLRTVLWLQRSMVWLILVLEAQYSILGKPGRVFNQMLWVSLMASCKLMSWSRSSKWCEYMAIQLALFHVNSKIWARPVSLGSA